MTELKTLFINTIQEQSTGPSGLQPLISRVLITRRNEPSRSADGPCPQTYVDHWSKDEREGSIEVGVRSGGQNPSEVGIGDQDEDGSASDRARVAPELLSCRSVGEDQEQRAGAKEKSWDDNDSTHRPDRAELFQNQSRRQEYDGSWNHQRRSKGKGHFGFRVTRSP